VGAGEQANIQHGENVQCRKIHRHRHRQRHDAQKAG
jgi:hypothetical protein